MHKFFNYILNNAFGLVELLLLIRIIMSALGANGAAAIVAAIYSWSDALLQPVQYIFPNIIIGGGAIDSVAISGMIFYAIIYFILFEIAKLTFIFE